ncbi:MAG: hypothetical protein ACI9ES_002302 [Oceanospirillaceae bacterium]|jgi:hypothetical protein
MKKSNRVGDIDKSKKERWIVWGFVVCFVVLMCFVVPQYF